MPSNIAKTKFEPGDNLTCRASAAVTGKRFVKISENSTDGDNLHVAHATAAGGAFGVSAYDADSTTTVPVIRGNKIVTVKAGANLSAGQDVEVGTAGVAVLLDEGVKVGTCVRDAALNADALIALDL